MREIGPRTTVAIGLVLLATTALDGATTHVPAWLLRAMVVVGCVAVFPRAALSVRRRDLWAPAVALGVVVMGLGRASDVGPALQATLRVVLVCGLYLTLVVTEDDLTRRLKAVGVAVGCAHALWAVAQRVAFDIPRGHGGFFNPNDLSALLAPLTLIAIAEARELHAAPHRRAWMIGAAICGVGVLATGSRGGLLAVGGGLAVWGVGRAVANPVSRPTAVRWRSLAAAAVLLLCGAAGVAATYERWIGHGDPYAYTRATIWRQSAAIALREPLGVGLGSYRHALRRSGVPVEGPVRYPKVAKNGHSEVIHAWVELGWLGLLAVGLPVGMLLQHLRARRRFDGAHIGILVAFAVPALVSMSLHVPPVAYLAAVWAAAVVRTDEREGARWSLPAHATRRCVVAALSGALLVAAPAAVSSAATERATVLGERGDLSGALAYAALGSGAAPWSVGAAMLVESLRYRLGEPPLAVAERLIDLAERFEYSPRPLVRAAWLTGEHGQRRGASADGWTGVAALWQEAARRDPRNISHLVAWGRALLRAQRPDEAQRAFERAVALEPHCARALAHLSGLAAARGARQRAEALREAALRADGQAQRWTGYPHKVLSLDEETRTMVER